MDELVQKSVATNIMQVSALPSSVVQEELEQKSGNRYLLRLNMIF